MDDVSVLTIQNRQRAVTPYQQFAQAKEQKALLGDARLVQP